MIRKDVITVLLVDEDDANGRLVSSYEEKAPWGVVSVLHVRSVPLALSRLRDVTPDAVVLDLDGLVVEEFRSLLADRETTLVVLSPDDSGGHRVRGPIGRAVRQALRCRQRNQDREPTEVHNLYEGMRHSFAEAREEAKELGSVSRDLKRTVRDRGRSKLPRSLTPMPFPAAVAPPADKG